MNKLIGILGCGGGVGQYVVNYLKGKYPLKCGQRKIVNMNADTDIEYVQVDVRNRKELISFAKIAVLSLTALDRHITFHER